jgi:multicomponent Na+:H+ antiporter subunit C
MEGLFAIVIGTLFGTGTYMILRRSIVKLVLGLMLLTHGANLLLFTVGGLSQGTPPLLGGDTLSGAFSDPLPQALILTAIVIGFGLTAFTLVLAYRVDQAAGTDNLEEMVGSDQ